MRKAIILAGTLFFLSSTGRISEAPGSWRNFTAPPKSEEATAIEGKPYILELSALYQDSSISGRSILLPPHSMLDITSNDFMNGTIQTTSISGKHINLEKIVQLQNPADRPEEVLAFADEKGILCFQVKNAAVRNGPYTITPSSDGLQVSTEYGAFDVNSIRVIQDSRESSDTIDVIDEPNYPPHFVSNRLARKATIDEEDILWMLKSYENQMGDYFSINPRMHDCTGAFIPLLKTVGIDYEALLADAGLLKKEYSQRHTVTFYEFLKKCGLYEDNVHYFMEQDKNRIFESRGAEGVVPEEFGLERFSVGQILVFNRYFLTGPDKGAVQKDRVHNAVISETDGQKIKKIAMVTSTSTVPPYNEDIKLVADRNFTEWFNLRLRYTGSDETQQTLTYRPQYIVDFPRIINKLKSRSLD